MNAVHTIKTFFFQNRTTGLSADCRDTVNIAFHLTSAFNSLAAVDNLLLPGFIECGKVKESVCILHQSHSESERDITAVFCVHVITSTVFLTKSVKICDVNDVASFALN